MSGFYDRVVVPRLINWVCGSRLAGAQRAKIVPRARGVVLDVGAGPGTNLELFDKGKVKQVYALEPGREIVKLGEARYQAATVPVEIMHEGAENIPLGTASVDTVVMTYTGCSIGGIEAGLAEMRRVLKPSGAFLFCEHGRSDEMRIARRQDAVNPWWLKVSGGCNLNRDFKHLIEEAGFSITGLEMYYSDKYLKSLSFHYLGSATKR